MIVFGSSPLVRDSVSELNPVEYATDSSESSSRADLSLNTNPLGASPAAVNKIQETNSQDLSEYSLVNGKLTKEIAKKHEVEPDTILLGDGCDGCLEMITRTFLHNNDTVLIQEPNFHRFEVHSKIMGAQIEKVDCGLDMNTKKLTDSISKNAKIVYLSNPNNPTGVRLEAEGLQNILRNSEGLVIVDEALASFEGSSSHLVKEYPNLIITRSFSKLLGLANLRIGYAVAHPSLINSMKKVSSPFKVSGVAQEAAIETILDKKYLDKTVTHLKNELQKIKKRLEELNLPYTESETINMLVKTPDTSNPVKKLKEKGVQVTSTEAFGLSSDIFRVSIGTKDENDYFLQSLTSIVEE